MKMLQHVYRAIPLTILFAIILAISVRPTYAGAFHYRCAIIVDCDQNHVLCLSRIDILYPGTPEPGIFTDITIFEPFTYYETDGETYLYIFPSEPIDLSGPPRRINVVTFETILDWGMPAGPTPFTFVEYDVTGFKVTGVIYNIEEGVGGFSVPVDKLTLLAPYIGLVSTIVVATAATAVHVKRVKRGREK